MKWPHCPKMYSLLLSIFVIIGSLLGAPVDQAILDQLRSADALVDTHATLSEEHTSLSITLAPMRAPSDEEPSLIKLTALTKKPGKQEFEFLFRSTGKSLTTAVGLSIDDHVMNRFLPSRAMEKSTAPDGEGKSSTSSIHLPNVMVSNLVSTEATEMVRSDKHTVNTGAKPLDLASTKPFLPMFSTIEISSEDEKLAWRREVTTPMFKFSTQPMLSSEGTPVPDTKDTLQNSSALNCTHFFDAMESHTLSSGSAESSTFKLTSVEQIIKTRPGSTLSTAAGPTLHASSAEPDFTTHLKTDATSWNSGTFKQLATSSWPTNSGSPTSSEGNNWRSPDVSEEEYSAAASPVPTNWLPDASEDGYSTAASSVPTNWLPDVSEDEYSTAASSVPTNWLPDVSEDGYSTAASSVPTNWLPDVSEDGYSTAASSVPTNWLPDASEDEYSTAASSVPTNWLPDVSPATNWPSSSSEAAFSMSLPQTQPTTLEEEFSPTDELPSSSEEYFSTSSTTNLLPSTSEALSSPTNWKPNPFEKLSTSLDNTSYQDPFTGSAANGIDANVSEVQPFTMTITVGTKPEATSFTIESSETASHSQTGPSTSSVIHDPFLLQFGILDLSYTDALSNRSSEACQELEMVVKGTLDAIFYARYADRFLETKILRFANGSVKVESEVVFQEGAALPSSSDVVRTVLTHVYHKDLVPTDLEINASSVVCNGYSLVNLEPERILIEFTALSTGFGPWSDEATFYQELLQRLSSWVVATLEEKYLVQAFNIGRVIPIQGDVNIQGIALLTTSIHVDDAEALLLLTNLVNNSVDLRSLKVNGSSVNFGVLPVSFTITNREYNTTLRDSRSAYFCSLGKAVTQALQTILKPRYSHFMQAVMKQFGSGSVISTSDLVFLSTPPASNEVLDIFFNSVDSEGFLAGTDFTVDAYSFTVGAARLDRPYEHIHFPGFGIAIILLCGLAVISLPVLAFLCWKYRFCAACQKSFTFEAWDVERENASVHIPLPEVNRESYRLHEAYVNYSFES